MSRTARYVIISAPAPVVWIRITVTIMGIITGIITGIMTGIRMMMVIIMITTTIPIRTRNILWDRNRFATASPVARDALSWKAI